MELSIPGWELANLDRRTVIGVGVLLVVVGVGAAIFISGMGEGAAKLANLAYTASEDALAIEATVTLSFEELPSSTTELTDVVVRFNGDPLTQAHEVGWAHIAANDDCTQTVADQPPTVGSVCTFSTPLALRETFDSRNGEAWVRVDVDWGGEKQHYDYLELSDLYEFD